MQKGKSKKRGGTKRFIPEGLQANEKRKDMNGSRGTCELVVTSNDIFDL